ncbi:unnamed protein product [Meloidogyne enterolobii]|uniref:Uncharacterized protein n=4 Tax=Meloidogyne enterolobii TaxID=390850 RepID=A0ACB0XZF7_MELEN
MRQEIIMLILLFGLFSSSESMSKLEANIATKKILKEMCSGERHDSDSGKILCDTIINFMESLSISGCVNAAKLLAGTVNCEISFSNYAEFLESTCKNYFLFNNKLWCPLRDPCCIKHADEIVRGLFPSCSEIAKAIIDLSSKICNTSKNAGVESANEGCRVAVNLAIFKPRQACYQIFSPTHLAPSNPSSFY